MHDRRAVTPTIILFVPPLTLIVSLQRTATNAERYHLTLVAALVWLIAYVVVPADHIEATASNFRRNRYVSRRESLPNPAGLWE